MFREYWQTLSNSQRFSFSAGVAVILVLSAVLVAWLYRTEYGVLFRSSSDDDAALILQELEKRKVDYRLADDGKTILVNKEMIPELRVKISSEKLSLGATSGFEIFDHVDYGMSDFTQNIYFQRALEGELVRTISAIDNVKFARVHLVLPEVALFAQDKQNPKASVTIINRPGQFLTKAQVTGIQQLVASSVKGMEPYMVSVSDGNGVLLSPLADPRDPTLGSMLEQKQAIEAYLGKKAGSLLERALGAGEAVVSVDVTLNYDRVQTETQEVMPDKSGRGVLVRSKNSTSSKSSKSVDNVAKSSDPASSSRLVEESFEVSHQSRKILHEVGDIERITVSVLIPDTVTEEHKRAIASLVSTAVGLDESRGDTLDIQSLALGKLPGKADHADEDAGASTPSPLSAVLPISTKKSGEVRAVWLVVGLIAFSVVLVVVGVRRSKSRALTDAERRMVLRDIQQWLAEERHGVQP